MFVGLNAFWMLLVGLIVGWLIEWVIDWVYWRRRTISRTEYTVLQANATQWKTERDTAQATVNLRTKEVADLKQRLMAAQQTDQQSRVTLNAAETTLESQQSELAVAKRVIKQQQVDLSAANELIARHELTIRGLNDTIASLQPTNEQFHADLTQADTVIEQHTADSATGTLAQQAGLSSLTDQHIWDGGAAAPEPQLHANVATPPEMAAAHELEVGSLPTKLIRDSLIDINGIGPVYQERLYAAGIYTFAQIAEQPLERLREIVAAKAWQDIEPEAWIAEAREFAKQVQEGTYGKGRANG